MAQALGSRILDGRPAKVASERNDVYLTQYRGIDDDRWRFLGEYPTKAEAATAANVVRDYSTRVHRINQAWQSQFPNNCAVVEVTGDGDEVGACTYHLKNGVCPRHGEVKEER